MENRPTILYVHGLFSPPRTWERFSNALGQVLAGEHRIFAFHSPVVNLSITSRIPDLDTISRKFLAFVSDAAEQHAGPLFLVGQSLGCLVIQNCLLICQRERQDLLDRTRTVILFGPPNYGSGFLANVRRFYRLLRNPQERILTAYHPKTAEIQRRMVEDFLYGQRGGVRRRIAFHVFVGEKDAIVPLASAMAHFQDIEIVEGDHSSLIQDVTTESYVVKRTASLIREGLHAPPTYNQSVVIRPVHPARREEVRAICELQNRLFKNHEKIAEQQLSACLLASRSGSRPYQTQCMALYDGNETVGLSLFSYDHSGVYVGFVGVDSDRTSLQADHLYRYLREFAIERNVPIFFEVMRADSAKIRLFLKLGAKFIGGVSYAAPDIPSLGQGDVSLVPHYLMVYFPRGSPAFLPRKHVLNVIEAIVTFFYFDWYSPGENNPELETKRIALIDQLTKELPERCPISDERDLARDN